MARINFETSVYKEQGFIELCIYTKDRQKAKGICLELWELAQKFWFPNKLLIPHDEFKASDLPEILYSKNGLADFHENGIYARGTREAFAWLFDAQAGGKASAEARKAKYGSSQPTKTKPKRKVKTSPEVPSSAVQVPPNGLEGVSTSLLSSLSSLLPTLNSPLSVAGKAPIAIKNDFQIIPELRGYEPLDQVLCSISTNTQIQWITRYKNSEWVKQALSDAVDHYIAKANGEPVTEWPVKLIGWLKRDKNKPTNGQTADPFSFLPDDEVSA